MASSDVRRDVRSTPCVTRAFIGAAHTLQRYPQKVWKCRRRCSLPLTFRTRAGRPSCGPWRRECQVPGTPDSDSHLRDQFAEDLTCYRERHSVEKEILWCRADALDLMSRPRIIEVRYCLNNRLDDDPHLFLGADGAVGWEGHSRHDVLRKSLRPVFCRHREDTGLGRLRLWCHTEAFRLRPCEEERVDRGLRSNLPVIGIHVGDQREARPRLEPI